jgi:hypothetical protein
MSGDVGPCARVRARWPYDYLLPLLNRWPYDYLLPLLNRALRATIQSDANNFI